MIITGDRKISKICRICGCMREITHFRRDKKSLDGYKNICRSCEDKIADKNAKSGGKNPI